MKRFLKFSGYFIGIIVLLAIIFGGYIQLSSLPVYENKAISIEVVSDSMKLAEGEKIVNTLCSSCHLSEDGKLGGKEMIDASSFGKIFSTNITNHPKHGALSKYTDGELVYLIRTGIKKDGTYAPPWMVKLPSLSDYDMEAILSYLRSDAEELKPSDKPNVASEFNFLAKMLIKLGAFSPLPYPEKPIMGPPINDKVAYGKYLALSKYDCFACHSADFASCDFKFPEKSAGFLGGGNKIPNLDGTIILSANLTMDAETGLGNWTEEEFIRAVKSGVRPNKIANRYPMPPYTRLDDDEVSAIWAYLKTVPSIKNSNDFTPDMD